VNRHLVAHNRFLTEVYPDEKPCQSILYLDVETRSEADLKKVGAWEYAAHPSTEIMNASFAVDDTPIRRWTELNDRSITEAIQELSDPTVLLCFHNAEFETAIFTEVCGLTIPTHRILDSAAVARHANLPGALEHLGAFYGFDKDMDGNRIMLKLSKPRRPSKANPDLFWRPETKPEDFEKTYEYCDRDVEVSRHAMNNMPAMSVFESQVYAATFDMNRRGVRIDRDSAQRMHVAAEKEKDRLSKEIERDFGFTLGQVSQIADYLDLDSVAKAPLRDLLKDPSLPASTRRVAEARQTFAKTSLNKLPKFLSRSATDGRARGNLIYAGAERTCRFSGSGIQMQNLTRGIGKLQETVFAALETGLFEYLYDSEIIDTLSNCLRGLIEENKGLYVGDYAQIEARMLAWLAGDEDLLSQFRKGLDPYRIMASKIYRIPVDDVDDFSRFLGKQTILGAGYQLSHRGFQTMLDMTYDVQIETTEAKSIIEAYRKNAPKIVAFWGRIQRAMLAARGQVGKIVKVNDKIGITFPKLDEMHIILPSKRRLRYYQVKLDIKENGFTSWTCFGKMKTGAGYGRVSIYGGSLTGHITQSSARDVMASAIVRLWRRGYPLILTVHDEIVSLAHGSFQAFSDHMEVTPDWLTDFPLKVDAFETRRYRK